MERDVTHGEKTWVSINNEPTSWGLNFPERYWRQHSQCVEFILRGGKMLPHRTWPDRQCSSVSHKHFIHNQVDKISACTNTFNCTWYDSQCVSPDCTDWSMIISLVWVSIWCTTHLPNSFYRPFKEKHWFVSSVGKTSLHWYLCVCIWHHFNWKTFLANLSLYFIGRRRERVKLEERLREQRLSWSGDKPVITVSDYTNMGCALHHHPVYIFTFFLRHVITSTLDNKNKI